MDVEKMIYDNTVDVISRETIEVRIDIGTFLFIRRSYEISVLFMDERIDPVAEVMYCMAPGFLTSESIDIRLFKPKWIKGTYENRPAMFRIGLQLLPNMKIHMDTFYWCLDKTVPIFIKDVYDVITRNNIFLESTGYKK